MSDSNPPASPQNPAAALIARASAKAYCRPALRELAMGLAEDDITLSAALRLASEARNAKAFTHIYVAALYAGRTMAADLLTLGAPLLPDPMILLHTALRLEGDVAEVMEAAVRSGRMGMEREGVAVILAWLDYERRGIEPPEPFKALARRVCREFSRCQHSISRVLLEGASAISQDPLIGRMLMNGRSRKSDLDSILERMRSTTNVDAGWDVSVPAHAGADDRVIGAGATVTRAIPKAGRNDPCPCGSGRKFKQCCANKISNAEQYAVDGIIINEAAQRPELLLTEQKVSQMRSHELYCLNPKHIPHHLAGWVTVRLVTFREIDRAFEVLEAAGPENIRPHDFEEICFELFRARDPNAIRRLHVWSGTPSDGYFDTKVLLAPPAERWELLCSKAAEIAVAEPGSRGLTLAFNDLAHGALIADPALGVHIARAVLPSCGDVNYETVTEDIEDALDLLGIADDNPAFRISEMQSRDPDAKSACPRPDPGDALKDYAEKAKRSDEVVKKLTQRVEHLRIELANREAALARRSPAPSKQQVEDPASASREVREMREEMRRIKETLKVEHDELNHTNRELRQLREQMRRSEARGTEAETMPESRAESSPDERNDPGDESDAWQKQPLRVPDCAPAFRDALQQLPRQAGAAALSMIGRLAGGDPSAWQSVSALRQRPGVLRARVAGDYRLLFATNSANSLLVHDLILRRDLEKWIDGGR